MFVSHSPQIKNFRDYVELYLRGISPTDEEDDLPRKIVYESVNPRWEVAVTASPCGFQQSSFVNSIATTKVHGPIFSCVCVCVFVHVLPTIFVSLVCVCTPYFILYLHLCVNIIIYVQYDL